MKKIALWSAVFFFPIMSLVAQDHSLKDKVRIEKQNEQLAGIEKWTKEKLGQDIKVKIDWSTFKRGFSETPSDQITRSTDSALRDTVSTLISISKSAVGKEAVQKFKAITAKNVERTDADKTKDDIDVALKGSELVISGSFKNAVTSRSVYSDGKTLRDRIENLL